MLVKGVISYFKSLSVGSGIESSVKGLFSGFAKKTTLIYANENFGESNKLTIDATLDFNISMETKLLETPAENQQVYTSGALRQPKTITIKGYIELDKMSQLYDIHKNTIPLWVVCEKPIPSTMNQRGYYADASMYAIQVISIANDGYNNCVAVTITLKEIFLFDYETEYLYDKKRNKINKGATNKDTRIVPQSRSTGHDWPSVFGKGLINSYKTHNLGGGRL